MSPHQQGGWRTQEAGMGTELGQLALTVQRDIPYHMVSSSVHKLMESCLGAAAQDGASVSEWWAIVLCITCFDDCDSFIITFFPCLCALLSCLYLNPLISPFFIPPNVCPIPFVLGSRMSEQMCDVYPGGLNHNSSLWHPTRSRAWRVEITMDLTRA